VPRVAASDDGVQGPSRPVAQVADPSKEKKLYGLHKELFELSGGRYDDEKVVVVEVDDVDEDEIMLLNMIRIIIIIIIITILIK
jgi:hypothetical protein